MPEAQKSRKLRNGNAAACLQVREALTRLGLHETDYGRAAIAAARPAQPPRLDNYTSDQRAAMLAKQACK